MFKGSGTVGLGGRTYKGLSRYWGCEVWRVLGLLGCEAVAVDCGMWVGLLRPAGSFEFGSTPEAYKPAWGKVSGLGLPAVPGLRLEVFFRACIATQTTKLEY